MSHCIFLRRHEVLERCAISNTTLHRLITDGHFPQPVQIGPRSVAWIEEEIEGWINEKIKERDRKAAS